MHVNLNKYLSGPIENKEVKLLIAHNIVKLSSVCSFIWMRIKSWMPRYYNFSHAMASIFLFSGLTWTNAHCLTLESMRDPKWPCFYGFLFWISLLTYLDGGKISAIINEFHFASNVPTFIGFGLNLMIH